jgi:cold shock CspA family protein
MPSAGLIDVVRDLIEYAYRDFTRERVSQHELSLWSPVQAVVKWYNPDKGFGFVQLANGSGDAFLHVSVVERSGHGSVPPGATLEVRAGPGPKGPR